MSKPLTLEQVRSGDDLKISANLLKDFPNYQHARVAADGPKLTMYVTDTDGDIATAALELPHAVTESQISGMIYFGKLFVTIEGAYNSSPTRFTKEIRDLGPDTDDEDYDL